MAMGGAQVEDGGVTSHMETPEPQPVFNTVREEKGSKVGSKVGSQACH